MPLENGRLAMWTMQTRRRFLMTASLAGGAALLGAPPAAAAEEPLDELKRELKA